jgi:hypothetical protein
MRHTSYWARRLIVVGCIGFSCLLAFLILRMFICYPDSKSSYDLIEDGMTEVQVEALCGSPIWTETDPRKSEGYTLKMPPDILPDGEPVAIKTVKSWWYDGDHTFEVFFDDHGNLVHKSLPAASPPRSPLRQWWRDQLDRFR